MGPLARALGAVAVAILVLPLIVFLRGPQEDASASYAAPARTAPSKDGEEWRPILAIGKRVAEKFYRSDIARIEVSAAMDDQDRVLTFYVHYSVGKAVHRVVGEADTRSLVRSALRALVAGGWPPAPRFITVVAAGVLDRRGETGVERSDWLCRAIYRPQSDALDNDPPLNLDALSRVLYMANSGAPGSAMIAGAAAQLRIDTRQAPEPFLTALADRMRDQTGEVQRAIAEMFGLD